MKLGATRLIQKVEPVGEGSKTPSQILQENLDQNRGTESGTLETIIQRQATQPASQDLSEYDQIMQEEKPKDFVEEELNLDEDQGSDLRQQALSLQQQAARRAAQAKGASPEELLNIRAEADKDIYSQGELSRRERALGLNTARYQPIRGDGPNTLTTNGGIFERADRMATKIIDPEQPYGIAGLMHPQPTIKNEVQPVSRNIVSTLTTIGATIVDQTTGRQAINPEFLKLASLITEDVIADQTMAESRIAKQSQKNVDTSNFGEYEAAVVTPSYFIGKMERNQELGERIAKAWGTVTNQPDIELDNKTKTYLGDMMKEVYYEVNKGTAEAPNLIRIQPEGSNQVHFQVTSHGQFMFRQSEAVRKLYFPKEHVDALDAPRSSGKTRISGKKGDIDLDKFQEISEAIQVLESIPHMVIPRREKILLATLLPALANAQAIANARKTGESPQLIEGMTVELNNMMASINGFGADKYATFKARAEIAKLDKQPFDIDANMETLQRNIAQALYGIAKHRGAPVYLTYFVQAFNGRLTPEQTHFNPVTNKQIRFVTGNPKAAVLIPGSNSELDRNLREMYSMMILKMDGIDAGDTLTDERLRMFDEGYDRLVSVGKDLKEALDNTDIPANEIMAAILQGMPLDHPDFPKFQALQINPSQAKLIDRISKKGEDGLALIDGLIDLYEYDQVLQKNKNLKPGQQPSTFKTHYNAYIDGKTNGIATNGAQLGLTEIAKRTGVLRSADSIYAVEDNEDLRDILADRLTESLDNHETWRNTMQEKYGDDFTAFITIARKLFTTRELNKGTTMTFGYGKELDSFKTDLRNYLVLNKTEAQEELNTLAGMDPEFLSEQEIKTMQLAKFYETLTLSHKGNKSLEESMVDDLFDVYIDKLVEVITPDGIKARKMMYNFAMFHVMMDEVFELETSSGMPLFLGGIDVDKTIEISRTSYGLLTPEKPEAKPKKDKYGNIITDKKTGRVVMSKPKERSYKQKGVELKEGPMYERSVSTVEFKKKATASAIRESGSGKKKSLYIGGAALGGSSPSVVQSVDAATVARTFSGKSAEKLRKANADRENRLYGLQIYDAFKSDVHNFKVMYNEVNQNWLQINKDYFYLDMANKKMIEASKKFKERMIDNNPNEEVSIAMTSGFRKIGEFLTFSIQIKKDSEGYEYEEISWPSLEAFFKRNLDPFRIGSDGKRVKKDKEELKEEARNKANDFILSLKKFDIYDGIMFDNDNPTLTKQQVYYFVTAMSDALDFRNDRNRFIYGKIAPQRKEYFAEVDKAQSANPPRMVAQYHAH